MRASFILVDDTTLQCQNTLKISIKKTQNQTTCAKPFCGQFLTSPLGAKFGPQQG
jgi:hypothetical protein